MHRPVRKNETTVVESKGGGIGGVYTENHFFKTGNETSIHFTLGIM